MMLLTGHPVWQNGTPQSMQRAPCCAQLLFGKILIDLEPVVHALGDRTPRGKFAAVLHEAGGLTHAAPALLPADDTR